MTFAFVTIILFLFFDLGVVGLIFRATHCFPPLTEVNLRDKTVAIWYPWIKSDYPDKAFRYLVNGRNVLRFILTTEDLFLQNTLFTYALRMPLKQVEKIEVSHSSFREILAFHGDNGLQLKVWLDQQQYQQVEAALSKTGMNVIDSC